MLSEVFIKINQNSFGTWMWIAVGKNLIDYQFLTEEADSICSVQQNIPQLWSTEWTSFCNKPYLGLRILNFWLEIKNLKKRNMWNFFHLFWYPASMDINTRWRNGVIYFSHGLWWLFLSQSPAEFLFLPLFVDHTVTHLSPDTSGAVGPESSASLHLLLGAVPHHGGTLKQK